MIQREVGSFSNVFKNMYPLSKELCRMEFLGILFDMPVYSAEGFFVCEPAVGLW